MWRFCIKFVSGSVYLKETERDNDYYSLNFDRFAPRKDI